MAGVPPAFPLVMNQVMFFLYLMRVVLNMRRHARVGRRRRLRYRERRQRPARVNAAFFLAALLVAEGGEPVHRGVWQHPRNPASFWDQIVLDTLSDAEWYKRFRMRKATFQMLCDELDPELRHKDTRMRDAISVQKRLAIGLYWLASGDLMRSVADLFGVSVSSACNIIHEVHNAINEVLFRRYLTFPTGQKLRETIHGFMEKWQFPQCAGAVDGSHIPINAPTKDPTDFFNRKGYHSVILQGVVDHLYRFIFVQRFTDICVGRPGSVHDARVLRDSPFFTRMESGTMLPRELTREIEGVPVPVAVLGDAAYPQMPWLVKPYPDSGALSREKFDFNYRQSRARMTVECAFGRLKGRWRCLSKRLDVDLDNVPSIVAACCVLHNVCEIHGDQHQEELVLPANDVQRRPGDHGRIVPNAARDALARHFAAGN
ncbi:uncharacterized protein LOC144865182 [Branchiostoma floridae x Branchiostoma japonicum]